MESPKTHFYGKPNKGMFDTFADALKSIQEASKNSNTSGYASIADRNFYWIDKIHILFLLYSGAHNIINAWHHTDSALFFLFKAAGIISVEIMLWAIYKNWKEGKFIGNMLKVAKWAFALAMFYATAGILAQTQDGGGDGWVSMYYQWILPTSAPVMFFFSFVFMAIDPVMKAQRDGQARDYFAGIEKQRERTDIEMMKLNERRDLRKLEIRLNKQKLQALHVEAGSRRTRGTLKNSAAVEMPKLLERAGVSIKDANAQSWLWLANKYEEPRQLGQGSDKDQPANAPVNPRKTEGSHAKK